MDGIGKSDYIHHRLTLLASSIGMNIIADGWHYNIRLRLSQTLTFFVLFLYVFNLQKFRNDFNYLCYSTILNAPIMGAVFRLYFWPSKYLIVQRLYESHRNLDQTNFHGKQAKITEKFNYFINVLCTFIIFSLLSFGVALAISPFLFSFIFNEQLEPPLPLYLVGIDVASTAGFIVNYIFQVIICLIGITLYCFIQSLVVVFHASVAEQTEILRATVRNIEQSILMNQRYRILKEKFIALIENHDKVLAYARDLEVLMKYQVLLDVTPFCIVTVIALYYARVANWYPGYLFAISIIVIGFLNTALIEFTTIQNEKLHHEIYGTSWYTVDVKLQKMYLMLLMKTQKTQFFTIGGLRPVGMDLYLTFCESVYSYLILLNDLSSKFID
ncbi:odorant receptor 49b-like [Culicoides brevitarsis]|uniref:odorant receptor 49b-like n=1 Tax=Culicoides brevitarsis TaxID=469753 RepID=UPI00307C27F1